MFFNRAADSCAPYCNFTVFQKGSLAFALLEGLLINSTTILSIVVGMSPLIMTFLRSKNAILECGGIGCLRLGHVRRMVVYEKNKGTNKCICWEEGERIKRDKSCPSGKWSVVSNCLKFSKVACTVKVFKRTSSPVLSVLQCAL